jgi:hypothetical protein
MIRDHGVDSETGHRLVDQNDGHAVAQAFFNDVRRRRAVHHDDRTNAILEHALDDGVHVTAGIRGIEQHALEAIGKQAFRERRQKLGMKRLVEIGADEADDVGARVGEALREPVDAITEHSGSFEDPRPHVAGHARAGVNVRETAERDTPACSAISAAVTNERRTRSCPTVASLFCTRVQSRLLQFARACKQTGSGTIWIVTARGFTPA